MAIKWAWGFSTDQTPTKLLDAGWTFENINQTSISTTQKHTYSGDAVTKRASMSLLESRYVTIPETVALDGWISLAIFPTVNIQAYAISKVYQTGLSSIYVIPNGGNPSSVLKLYVSDTYKASSTATISKDRWNWVSLKYEGSTTTFAGTVYLDGVEIIARQTHTAGTAWSDLGAMNHVHYSVYNGHPTNDHCYFADIVTYDSLSDSGEAEVWCSTMEPTGDDSETGTWAPSTGATNFGVTTPWDTATYTENTAPASTDKVVMTCPNIATHLGITPTVYGLVSQAVVSGGSDFNALFNDGSTTLTGSAVTSNASNPTYGYATKSGGVTAGTTVKIGTKIP